MNLQQVKGFVELMKDIDSRNNLTESSKTLLPYMEWLVEQADKSKQVEIILSCSDYDNQTKLDNINKLFFFE